MNLKTISGNSLSETAGLLYRLIGLIEQDYLHVNENINPKILKLIKADYKKVDLEIDRREDAE